MPNGLFVGRFQPFHLGHLVAIKFALRHVEELAIVIGSAQKSHELRNPFTAGERIQMIKCSLNADDEVDLKKIVLIPVADVGVHSLWTYHIDIFVPSYQVVFTNDIFTCLLFKERGTKVVQPKLHQRKELSATEIRSRIAKGGDWKTLVTPQTVKIVEDIHGIERIKSIFAMYSDTND